MPFFPSCYRCFFGFILKDSCPKILYIVLYNLLKNPYVHFIHTKNYCHSTSIRVSMILFHVIIYALFCCVCLCIFVWDRINNIIVSFHTHRCVRICISARVPRIPNILFYFLRASVSHILLMCECASDFLLWNVNIIYRQNNKICVCVSL